MFFMWTRPKILEKKRRYEPNEVHFEQYFFYFRWRAGSSQDGESLCYYPETPVRRKNRPTTENHDSFLRFIRTNDGSIICGALIVRLNIDEWLCTA